MKPMIIGKKEFDQIRQKAPGESFFIQLDCGRRSVSVKRKAREAILDGLIRLRLNQKIKDNFLYLLENEGVREIAFFSEQTNRFYKLVPTADWPTIAISSVPMHRRASPQKDTANKIRLLKPQGAVLDTCMGCGYTAILAAETARKVITFEKDEIILQLASLNPCSQALFKHTNIEIRHSDISVAITEFSDDFFDCIMHDPPTFTLAPELFSEAFYCQLFRVLKAKGRLFHYTPLYKVKQGFDFPASVQKKLKKTGFRKLQFDNYAGGILCSK